MENKNYFLNCSSIKEAKKQFRKYSMKLHPDTGGDKDKILELLKQWDEYKKRINGKIDNKYYGPTVSIPIVKIVRETDMAYLIQLQSNNVFNNYQWIPKSQIGYIDGKVMDISSWIYQKKFNH